MANHQWDHHERHPADTGDYLPQFQLQVSDDPRFATPAARRANAEALSTVLSEAFRHHTQREVDLPARGARGAGERNSDGALGISPRAAR